MREKALTFGPANLVGILTEPDPDVAVPDAPVVVILNSGIMHRAGASRLYVQVARGLAEDGFSSLRFDFSGIGDSEVRRDSIPIEQRFTLETREAMDYLETVTGSDRFIVGGLCSGADGAFWAGLDDERVVGIWQIDGFCYKTLGYQIRRYGPKLLNPKAWVHSVRVRLTKSSESEAEETGDVFVKPEYRRVFPPKEVVGEGLGALLERGVGLYFFFTGGLEEYGYANQHEETFPELDLGSRAHVFHIGEATHLVSDLAHQAAFLTDLRSWAARFKPATNPSVITVS
ncbi:MAG: hypothetical protein WD342_01015 [Verrucomicrobiales bacterium]